MQKSLLSLFCALCALFFIPVSVNATDYVVGDSAGIGYPLPIYTDGAKTYGSVSQQIIYASELTAVDASGGDITALTFYYTPKAGQSSVGAMSRSIQVYIMEMDVDSFAIDPTNYKTKFLYKSDKSGTEKIGSKVFEGTFATEALTAAGQVKSKTINFDSNFAWDGSTNLVLTIFDMSLTSNTMGSTSSTNLRYVLAATNKPRFAHYRWYLDYKDETDDTRSAWLSNMSNREADLYPSNSTFAKQWSGHKWVNKITFSITPSAGPVAPSTPENLAASSIGSTSASLSWSAVDGATSYDLYNSTSIDGVYSKFASPTTNSYDWSGLTANTTYYVKVAAVNGAGSSALSGPISFTTLAPHIHDGITFEPWSNPSAMPTSGNYYLNTDVELASDWNVNANINLCLNGHEVYTETNSIQVRDGATFAIYDNEGGGRIYGYFVANYPKYGLINIENGGTLVLSEGTIQNLYGSYEEDDDPDDKSLSNAIYNNGTLKLSGALTFTSYHADIYLGSNKYITIESEKPLTNSEPYSVYKSGKSVITSGWANMNGADPKDYFVSANTSLNIKMGETEAEFYPVISLSENNTNTAIGTYSGQMVDVNLTRSLTSSQYNTFCLPFALDDEQLQEFFGAGYDLREFESSSLDGEVLSLTFSDPLDALEAGKPYLLQPSVDVVNPSFEGVTIAATSPVDQTSDANISFHGTFGPTELTGGNKNLLFLGAENELFWPETTGNLKGFRAYFEVKGAAQKAAKRARIVKKEDSATGIDQITNDKSPMSNKIIKDNQFLILRDNKTYNVLGIECK